MKIVIAIDSFKESLSSVEAGGAVRRAVQSVLPEAKVVVCPMADGGEGTVDAFIETGYTPVDVTVTGPLGTPVTARYAVKGDRAVMEMAAAAGLPMVPPERRDPTVTTTLGVGEMIADAVGKGVRHFVFGLGGSATNDGGVGMLTALGFGFYGADGRPITPNCRGLADLVRIDTAAALPELAECEFVVACDVKNPLCGENGASFVFGPQKGADTKTVRSMDARLSQYADICKTAVPSADRNAPGAGAAGGLGFAFRTFLNATLTSGVDIVLRQVGLAKEIENADLVITGEGKIDGSTPFGKAPVGVTRLAGAKGVPVIAFCGAMGKDAENCNAVGIDAVFCIQNGALPLIEALRPDIAAENLYRTAVQVLRFYKKFTK